MAIYRHAIGHEAGRGFAIGVVAVVVALLTIVLLAEHGIFTHNALGVASVPLPGVTLDDDDADRQPVVTSVRSDGEAERAGIRAGDEIEAVDGRRVRDVAGLRAALVAVRDSHPVALHVRRGSALWTVWLDRAEPSAGNLIAAE